MEMPHCCWLSICSELSLSNVSVFTSKENIHTEPHPLKSEAKLSLQPKALELSCTVRRLMTVDNAMHSKQMFVSHTQLQLEIQAMLSGVPYS